MATYKRGLIVAGVILLALGATSLYFSNAVHSFQSTLNVLPTRYFRIASNLRDQTYITGQFQETSGRAVTFYIMSSAQFASFQLGQATANLYAVPEVASGSISFTSSVPDTYYLVFTHGQGLLNVTQTVNFQRTYTSLDDFHIASGGILLVLGVLEIYWGARLREAYALPPPPRG